MSLETKGTSKTMKLTGGMEVKFSTVLQQSGAHPTESVALPTEFTFTGTYAGSTVTSFTGALGAKWTDPNLNDDFPKGTVTVNGSITASGQTSSVDLKLTSDGVSKLDLDIDLTRGPLYLRGTATGQFDAQGEFTQASMNLQNQDGLKVAVTTTNGGNTVAGTISTVTGTKVADIEVDPDLKQVTVRYTDGTYESLA